MKILFITSNRLGDAVLSTGILDHLLEQYPDAALTVACGPLPAPLFRNIPQAVQVIELIKSPWAGHWRRLWRQTIGTRWDIVVDLRQSFVSRLIYANKRYIWKKSRAKLHKVEELSRIIADPTAEPRLWYDPSSLEQASSLIPRNRMILAIAPGANSIGKKWPGERYKEVIGQLTAPTGIFPDAFVIILGGKQDRDLVSIEGALDLTGQTDVNLAAACLSLANFYIGNDSGLTHLAAAAGTPTLALFGPGVAWKYAPWGPHTAYVSKSDDPDRMFDLCRNGDDAAALSLMERLSVKDVVDAAASLWHKIHP